MSQKHSDLGERAKAWVRSARIFDEKMDGFGHTLCNLRFILSYHSQKMDDLSPIFEPIHTQIARGRGAFAQLPRRKSSTVPAPSCGLLLKFTQNRSRLNKSLSCHHGLEH